MQRLSTGVKEDAANRVAALATRVNDAEEAVRDASDALTVAGHGCKVARRRAALARHTSPRPPSRGAGHSPVPCHTGAGGVGGAGMQRSFSQQHIITQHTSTIAQSRLCVPPTLLSSSAS